jgi:hypothetical protein
VQCFASGKEAATELCGELFNREFKILLYVDSTGCSSCRLKLFEWKQLIEGADSLFHGSVGFLLFFQPKDPKELGSLFVRDFFDHPVFLDATGKINSLNHFPQAQQYQCFLLDSENKVLMIGNPVLNYRIWELYKEQIAGKTGFSLGEFNNLTTLKVDKEVHNFGNILKDTANPAVFTITNTGNHPLVISQVSASCGCTNVVWDKKPVETEQTAEICVEMKAEETGYFSKTVEVYCNIRESPVKFTVTGTTIELTEGIKAAARFVEHTNERQSNRPDSLQIRKEAAKVMN